MGEVAPLRGGYAFKSEKYVDNGIPIVRISNILPDGTIGAEFAHYSKQIEDDIYSLKDGAALLAMSGATTGKVSILHCKNTDKYYQNQRVGYFEQGKEFDYEFVSTIVRSLFFAKQLTAVLVAGAQPNVSSKDIDSFEFLFPKDKEEQQKIGHHFRNLDNLITLHQCECLGNSHALSILPCPLSSRKMTSFWEQRKFVDLYNYASEGGTPDTNNSSFYENGDVPFVKIEDTENKYIDSAKSYITQEGLSHSSAWMIPENSVIFTNGATVGNVAINRLPVATKQGILGIIPSKKVVTEFLFYLLSSSTFQREVRSRMATGTFATIILKNLNQIPVCIPSDKSEQEEIAGYLSAFDNLITLHQRECLPKTCSLASWFYQQTNRKMTSFWEQRKLSDIAERFDNLRIPVAANLRIAGSTPYYGANGIQDYVDGYTHDGEFVLVAEDGANDLKNYPVQYVKGRIWVNNHAHVLQGKAKILDNRFLTYVINQADIESLLVGCGRAKLNAETMMNIVLPIPAIKEQQIIGCCLSKLDNLITLHQRIKINITGDYHDKKDK